MSDLFLYLLKRVCPSDNPFYCELLFKLDNFQKLLETENPIIHDIFLQLQKMYHGFARLAHLYKYKKATIQNTHDLGLNPITHKNVRKTFLLLQGTSMYIMTIPELINIINTSLSYANSFFILESYFPKNPYTNVPLNKSTLYNIYFAVKNSDYKMPPLFHAFFMNHFVLPTFVHKNKHAILEYVIYQYVYTSHASVIYNDIIRMLKRNDISKKLYISPEFPKEVLVNIMRPYLHLEYRCKYSDVCDDVWMCLTRDLNNMLCELYVHNPKFGRKYIKRIGKKKEVTFDTSHPELIKISRSNLMMNFV